MSSATVRVIATRHPDVKILEPRLFEDSRGFLIETYNERVFAECIEDPPRFVQDNHSSSVQHVLRGLHYQVGGYPQAKLVRVLSGKIFDVAVDLRRGRATFGQWIGEILSADNRRQLWVPEGFAHGFLVLSERADCAYKLSALYRPDLERCLRWNDPDIGVEWPLSGSPILSDKDRDGLSLAVAEHFA